MAKNRNTRTPKLHFSTLRGIGWHVTYRDPPSGIPKKHRFGIREKDRGLAGQIREVERALERCGDTDEERGDVALTMFDFSREACAAWQRSTTAEKRAIRDTVSLNRLLSAASLWMEKRKPLSYLAKRPSIQLDRGDRI